MPAANAALSNMADAHEERLQRLEGGFQDVSVQLAKNTTACEFLSSAVTESAERIEKRLEETLKPLATTLASHIEADTALAQKLIPIIQAHEARSKKLEAIRKGLWGVVLAAAGIGAKELIVWLFHHAAK